MPGKHRAHHQRNRIELKTGELLILNQNAVQEIEPAGRDDIAVNFLILPEFFDQTLRMIGAEENQLKDFIVGCLKSGEVPLCYLLQNRGCPSGAESDRKSRLDALTSPEQ